MKMEAPTLARANVTRCSRVPCAVMKECAKCTQNSTEIPMAITMFTTDTAFRLI